MIRSYQLRIRPNKEQVALLNYQLGVLCELYNAALQERKEAWKLQRKSLGLYDQYNELTQLRQDPEDNTKDIASEICRDPLRRVDLAFRGMFRRRKVGKKPGYPRYRSMSRYDSFCAGTGAFQLKDNKIRVTKIGTFHFRASQPIVGIPKQITVKRQGSKWEIRLVCDIGHAPSVKPAKNPVGIDLGTKHLLVTSDRKRVKNPKFGDVCQRKIAEAQRSLATKKRGSNNRRKAKELFRREHQHLANCRVNYSQRITNWLLRHYDGIVYEDLGIQKMSSDGSPYAKSNFDAAWGKLLYQLRYKAEYAGIPVIAVDPRNKIGRASCRERV